jgi:septum formation protein
MIPFPLVLGSQSPRRREILAHFSLPFIPVSPAFDEEAVPFDGNPEHYVCTLSKGKADSLAGQFPESIILTADTIVFREGRIYGKPKNGQEAYDTLLELSGKWHSVYTGVTVRKGDKSFHQAELTSVLFNALTLKQIENYIAKTSWQDKAGGYAIQMPGGLVVRKIEGCYYNVMGLPLNTVAELLRHFDVQLWDFLRS